MSVRAAIDNDFLNHLLEIKNSDDLPELIRKFFRALKVSVFMHQFVYEREAIIMRDTTRETLVSDNTIEIVKVGDTWKNISGGREYYSMMVKEIYKSFTGKDYPCSMFDEWKAGCSLGEVHTVVACAFIMCDCFLSDDHGAATYLSGIVQRKLNHPINIYNRQNRCEYIRSLEPIEWEGLTSHDLKMISH